MSAGVTADPRARVVFTTAPSEAQGALIARAIVERGLAACVTILSGARAIYVWNGEAHDDAEVVLMVKTHVAQLDAIDALLGEIHPYEVPELIALPITEGSASYLGWLAGAVSPSGSAGASSEG